MQKRADGFHDLETIFYPVPLRDGLEILHNSATPQEEIVLTTSGLPIDAQAGNNICVKAYHLLKKDFPQLPSVTMHLHKVIPSGAGLGGGSADGAFTLLLLNKKFHLQLSQEQLIQYALQLGSDCPFFILNKPCFATCRGENLQTLNLDLSPYQIVLINPKIHINTGWAFSQITPGKERPSLRQIIALPVHEWKQHLHNDFEEAVFSHHPETKNIKEELYRQGAVYASMSGSGSTVYGLFEKNTKPQLSFPSHYFISHLNQ